MKKVAIVGLGLMGASLCMAIRKRRISSTVVGYARRRETRVEAVRRGIVGQAFSTAEEAVAGADMVVLCLPVLAIPDFVNRCRNHFKKGAVITDVGSTKANLMAAVSKNLRGTGVCFVGSHPIAGSDERGLGAARANLYDNVVVVVTPPSVAGHDRRPARQATRAVCDFWRKIGARVCVMEARKHDAIVARTSHLPHLVAAALAETALRDEGYDITMLCGCGLRDTTRIAGGSEDIWHDIIKTNKTAIRRELAGFSTVFKTIDLMLKKDNFSGLRRFLASARDRRRSLDPRT
jgi:prephenate dehydrogenase